MYCSSVKVVAVGDGAVGKTSLLIAYTSGTYGEEYVPTIFDNYSALVMYENEKYSLSLCDTAGQEDYDRLRSLSYPGTDVVMICYSTISPISYENVYSKWLPEIAHFCPKARWILVGTKYDIHDNAEILERLAEKHLTPLNLKEVAPRALKAGAIEALTCSSKTGQGVKAVFEATLKAFTTPIKNIKKSSAGCTLI